MDQAKHKWFNSDRARLWFLILTVLFAGLFSGIIALNTLFFLVGLSALIILVVRFGYGYSIMAGLLAVGSSLLLYGEIAALTLVLIVIVPALIMGNRSRTFSSPRSILFWGMLPFAFTVLAVIFLYPEFMAQAPYTVSRIQNIITENQALMGLDNARVETINESLKTALEWLLRLLPGILLTTFMAMVLFAYIGAYSLGPRFGAIIPRLAPLSQWRLGEFWLAPLGAFLLLTLLGKNDLRVVGENSLLFLVHLYAFFGICLVDFYFKRVMIPTPMRLVIYILVMIGVIVIIPILAVIGVIDSRFDFRKLSRISDKPSSLN